MMAARLLLHVETLKAMAQHTEEAVYTTDGIYTDAETGEIALYPPPDVLR
jgi:hypothetical protein